MKRTFDATVVSVTPTDTSGFMSGAHSVTFDVLAQSPLGGVTRRVELPLFSVEEAREFGTLYQKHAEMRITFQTGERDSKRTDDVVTLSYIDGMQHMRDMAANECMGHCPVTAVRIRELPLSTPTESPKGEVGEPSPAVETAQRRALRLAIMKTVKMLRDAVNGQLPSVNTCYSTYAELGAAADAVFGTPEHPPIVNGMPSCCEPVKGSLMRIAEHGTPKTKTKTWALGAHFDIEHCLYCGTKLPALDGAPS